MSHDLLVESRDPFDSRDSEVFYELARGLREAGNEVTLFLVQNGVLPTRKASTHATKLADLAQAQVTILADGFSLRERAIAEEDRVEGTKASELDHLVDGVKTLSRSQIPGLLDEHPQVWH